LKKAEIMKISDLPTGEKDLRICLRNGRKIRARGEVIETKQGKCFVTHHSPKESFGPGTKVCWHRKG
jgi:hypothetical protein